MAFSSVGYGQSETIEGEVSFVTSENIYARFKSTDAIEIGDTLYLAIEGQSKPCLIVEQKSSSSCVCKSILGCKPERSAKVIHDATKKAKEILVEEDPVGVEDLEQGSEENEQDTEDLGPSVIPEPELVEKIQKIRARLSASSYSSIDPDQVDRHRTMLRFSMNADRINNSRFSLETNVNYRKNFEESDSNSTISNSFVRVYNLAFRYHVDSSMLISLGRKINRKISSVGAIDGLQLDKSFGSIYSGAILGYRPDISDFGFNSNLFQYGIYLGSDIRSDLMRGQFTFGFMEQRNKGNIDRRYSYLQFSNSFGRKASLFASMELDLYKIQNQVESSDPRLTNLFLSFRYRFNRSVSVMMSFDSRKRIIYYETLRTEVDELLADDIARQGLRFRVNIRAMKNVFTGISLSRRFQSDEQNKSDNLNAFVSIARVPGIQGRMNFSYNLNKSDYLESHIKAVRYSRGLIPRKLNLDMYYRNVRYNYFNTETINKQDYYGLGFSWSILRSLNLNILLERSVYGDTDKYRFNTKLIKRFK